MAKLELPRAVVPILEQASDDLANNTCNDYFLDDTPENRRFMQDLLKWNGDDEMKLQVHKGQIATYDWLVMAYIAHLVESASN